MKIDVWYEPSFNPDWIQYRLVRELWHRLCIQKTPVYGISYQPFDLHRLWKTQCCAYDPLRRQHHAGRLLKHLRRGLKVSNGKKQSHSFS